MGSPVQAELGPAHTTPHHKHHHGQEEGFHDSRAEEEAPHSSPQEGGRGAEEGAGAQSGAALRPTWTAPAWTISRRSASSTLTSGTVLRERCSSCSARSSCATSRSTSSQSPSVT